ncbi:MAG: DNA translocase FtsK [Butyrivibrio sp.]|nr:DNA translocase FtsK [Butyrivibrio sp.]
MASNRGRSNSKNSKNSSRKKTTSRKRQSSRDESLDFAVRSEVYLICFLLLALFLFICNFRVCGAFGNVLSDIMFGLFGLTAYIAPIAGFISIGLAISNGGSPAAVRKITSGLGLVMIIGIAAELLTGRPFQAESYNIAQIYTLSSESRNGGGAIAGSVAYAGIKYLSTAGTILVLFALTIICLVLFTEKSFVNGLKRGGKKIAERTREDADLYRERAEERRIRQQEKKQRLEEEKRLALEQKEDEKILRMDKKVSGVMLDTSLQEDESEDSEVLPLSDISSEENRNIFIPDEDQIHDDIHEITLQHSMHTDVEPDGQRVIRTEPVIHTYYGGEEEPSVTVSDSPIYMQENDDNYPEEQEDSFRYEADSSYDKESPYEKESSYEEEASDEGDIYNEQFEESVNTQQPGSSFSEEDYASISIHKEGEDLDGDYVVHTQDYISQTKKSDDTQSRAMVKKPTDAAFATGNDIEGEIKKEEKKKPKNYVFPPISLLQKGVKNKNDSTRALKETALKLQETLKTFGVNVTITDISQGPAVTRYELQPEAGVKVSKIVSLSDDIKMNLAATDIRIEAPIPGKAAVGIEVPNKENTMVAFRDLLESDEYKNFDAKLTFAVGKDIGGKVVVTDIAKMPHLLIAGSTGSGKSVCINTIIMSIIYKSSPEDVKLILIDPKIVELSVYNGIPHLLIPVVTDPKKAAAALNWAVAEMTARYKKFADAGVRDLKGYNQYAKAHPEDESMEVMPQILVIVDELADLMMVSANEVEEAICRLTQLARAAGIHLIIATQRPSVDVITGLIKANMPSRIAFAVSSGVDSRTILDMNGAEKLLGKGDMLFDPQGYPKPARIQGAFISDKEVQAVTDFLKKQADSLEYSEEIQSQISSFESSPGGGQGGASAGGNDVDEYFAEAGRFIIEKDKASIGMLQRAYKIGFNRAARIMDQLCDAGVVGAEEGTKPRKILMTMDEFEGYLQSANG